MIDAPVLAGLTSECTECSGSNLRRSARSPMHWTGTCFPRAQILRHAGIAAKPRGTGRPPVEGSLAQLSRRGNHALPASDGAGSTALDSALPVDYLPGAGSPSVR